MFNFVLGDRELEVRPSHPESVATLTFFFRFVALTSKKSIVFFRRPIRPTAAVSLHGGGLEYEVVSL